MPRSQNSEYNIEKMKKSYKRGSKLLFVIFLLYLFWTITVIAGTYSLNLGYGWALISSDIWIYSAIVLFCFFIFIEIILILNFELKKKKFSESDKPKEEYYHGCKLSVYTTPKNAKGGFFGRTYIRIDDNSILRLRNRIDPPEE